MQLIVVKEFHYSKGEKYTFKMRSQDVSSLGVHAYFEPQMVRSGMVTEFALNPFTQLLNIGTALQLRK
jgi:IS4 transposase